MLRVCIFITLFFGLLSSAACTAGEEKLEVKNLKANELGDLVRGARGKVLVLNFWSTLSPVSKQEIPFLNSLHEAYKGKAVEIIGVNVEGVEPDVIEPFAEMMHIKYPVFVGSDDIVESYDLQFIPVTFVLDKSGKVRQKEIGYNRDTKRKLERLINRLLLE